MHNSKYQCKWQPWDSRQGGVAHAITLRWPTGTCWHSVPVLQSTTCRWRGLAKRQAENLQLDHKEWQWTFFEVKIKMRTKKTKKHKEWRGCGSVGRASDRHTADAGSIPWCGKAFFSQSPLSVQTLLRCPQTSHVITCINICAHVKDPVVYVRVWWITETLKHLACTIGWVAQLCCS